MQTQAQENYTPEPFDRKYFEDLGWLAKEHIDAVEKAHNDDQGPDEEMARYYVIVTRDRKKEQSRGYLCLYDSESDSDEPILKVPLVTGSAQRDPAKYGGCTPNILWVMTEEIIVRDHPHWKRGNQHMARIHPVYAGDMRDFAKRTYKLIGKYAVPFMIHVGWYYNGASTGCLAICGKKTFLKAVELLNMAFRANGGFLSISVEEV